MNTPESADMVSEAEWEARRVVAAALEPLDDAARGRVLLRLAERFDLDITELGGQPDADSGGAVGV